LLSLSRNLLEQFDDYDREELREHLKLLNHSVECLNKLQENLLTWSRVQRGTIEFQPKPLDLGTVGFETVYMANSQAVLKNITLNNQIAPRTEVFADRNMVSTVLRNLVSNAIKFTPAGGRVILVAQVFTGAVRVTVEDNGVGLSQAQLGKLFRLESQAKTSGTEGEEGTGLGLILCRELVEKNGGKIWVESAPQQGARFHFTLPTAG